MDFSRPHPSPSLPTQRGAWLPFSLEIENGGKNCFKTALCSPFLSTPPPPTSCWTEHSGGGCLCPHSRSGCWDPHCTVEMEDRLVRASWPRSGGCIPLHPSQAGGQVSRAVGPDFRAMGLARGHSHHPPTSVRPAEPPCPPPQPVCSVSFLKGYFSPPPLPNLSPHHHRRVKNSWRNRLLSPQFFASSCRTQASHPPTPTSSTLA